MEVLLSAEQIQKRVDEMARQIAGDYRGQPLTIVGVLTGSLVFLADLIRRIDVPLRIGLLQASSYRGAATTPGELRFSDELIRVFGKLSKEVLADTTAKDPLTRKVYDSYMAFLAGVMDWGELSETGYRDTRRLALG